ncbi:hypothetical protein V7148_02945 [Gottfriedia acidiceleris]|nr:hypothetical protein [Bacillus sp. AFS077874]
MAPKYCRNFSDKKYKENSFPPRRLFFPAANLYFLNVQKAKAFCLGR